MIGCLNVRFGPFEGYHTNMNIQVYRVNWLRAKATMDRRREEEELLTAEFQWTTEFFDHKARLWEGLAGRSNVNGDRGHACYAARQQSTYARLRERCLTEWDKLRASEIPNVGVGMPIVS